MSDSSSSNTQDPQPAPAKPAVRKIVVFAIAAGLAVFGYIQFGDALTLERLAGHEARLREFQQENPIAVYGLALLVYVSVTGLSLPGATVLTLAYAWYFGFARGLILVSFASTSGATLAFLLSRYLLRDSLQSRFGERLASFNDNLRREGAFYLFSLRLIPVAPFFVINAVMGLTHLRTSTFWWVSQVGMFPGTVVFVYTGSTFPNLASLAERGASGILSVELLIAFVILGLFPITIKKLMARFGSRETS